MNTAPIIYHKYNCYKTKIILTLNEFLNVKLTTKNIESLSGEDVQTLINKSPTSSFPLLHLGDYFLSGTRAIMKYLISVSSNKKQIDMLHSADPLESSHIEMWIDYAINNIWTIRENLLIEKTSNINKNNNKEKEKDDSSTNFTITSDEDIKKEALKALFLILNKLNIELLFKTSLVGSNLTLADIIIVCSLRDLFETKIIEIDQLKCLNNLVRWFKLVTSLKQYKDINGELTISFS